jgi:APA family basic amino acid/polyamine antiporter
VSAENLDAVIDQAKRDRGKLDSSALGPWSLTALGIASVVGAGIFATTGTAAAKYAGPSVVFTFLLAGVAAAAMALCYAELAAMIPAPGSTYSYAYAIFGLFPAWFIGWDLLLEYLLAASTVAVSWAGYAVSLTDSIGIHIPHSLTAPPFGGDSGVVNLPAILIVAVTITLLVVGTRQSARANNLMVVVKLAVLILFVVVGATYVTSNGWTPFIPAHGQGGAEGGLGGILSAGGLVFFTYVGFDAVSTAAAESRNPQRTIPIGLLATVGISTLLYVAVALVLTGMVPFQQLNVADPISQAIGAHGPRLEWLKAAVNIGAVVGLAGTVLVTFYGQTRIFMRMSEDGMLPARFGHISERTKTPVFSTLICGVVGATIAGLLPLDVLAELVSIGTLLAFLLVCSGVVVLRHQRPDLERPFRVPALHLIAAVGIVTALALMVTLPIDTWIRLAIWLVVGLTIFFGYAKSRAEAHRAQAQPAV